MNTAIKLTLLLILINSSNGYTKEVYEDFETLEMADLDATTGIWNTVTGEARAKAYSNGELSRPIDLGAAKHGALVSWNQKVIFNTNHSPNGFEFSVVEINGGTIEVKGSYPLVIRSLGPVQIKSTIDVSGGPGQNGSATTGSITIAPSGGTAVASSADGGAGGRAYNTSASNLDGGNARFSNGAIDSSATGGTGSTSNATAGASGSTSSGLAGNNFDSTNDFVGGASGAGGGGHYFNGDAIHASGGGGGAGGGVIHITAAGPIRIQAIKANGGKGGNTATSTTQCSGNGMGGNGGTVWIQSLDSIRLGANPEVFGGTSGINACSQPLSGLDGAYRLDTPTSDTYDTLRVPPERSFQIQSKGYPVDAQDPYFGTPTVDATAYGGQIQALYSGSQDGSDFTPFLEDLSLLSGKQIRYLRFRILIKTGTVVAPSPVVRSIRIPYSDLGPALSAAVLVPACSGLVIGQGKKPSVSNSWIYFFSWSPLLTLFLVHLLAFGLRCIPLRKKTVSGLI